MAIYNSAFENILKINPSGSKKISPSKTFCLEGNHITGKIDKKAAIEQAVKKIVFTDRYRWRTYSSGYGIDLNQFIGKDFSFLQAVLKEEITRALEYDDRVLSIQNFQLIKTSLDTCLCIFEVRTVFGNVQIKGEL